jgi:hypothetical protein
MTSDPGRPERVAPLPSAPPVPVSVPRPLDGEWKTLGEAAFAAFVRLTAEAIVTELAVGEDIPAGSGVSPSGLARPEAAADQRDAGARPRRARAPRSRDGRRR